MMSVRIEKGLKDEGTTLRYRRLSSSKSGLESAFYHLLAGAKTFQFCVRTT